jgi:hypothetical protein
MRTVKLYRVESVLSELSYPVDRETAVEALDDVTLLLADGEVNLGATIDAASEAEFEVAEDLLVAVHNGLPVEAVGEPGQSEGDA